MSTMQPRRSIESTGRLQALLVVLILWDLLAIAAELSFGGPLFKISGDEMGGYLAAKGSLSGAALAPIAAYFYALVKGPLRHRNVLWVAVVEQGAAALFAVYHAAANQVEIEGLILPLAVSLVLLVLVLTSIPRGQPVS